MGGNRVQVDVTKLGKGYGAEPALSLEMQRLDLERVRFRTETVKWIAIAVGAVLSFAVIDYGKLQLERFRSYAENERALLISYLDASNSTDPEVWKRKLSVIAAMSDDPVRSWAEAEIDYIKTFAARDALYRETLKVASQLVEPSQLPDPARLDLRRRFNQLYWADLPYVEESNEVAAGMIAFRTAMAEAEAAGAEDAKAWSNLNLALIRLSKALRASTTAR